MLSSTEIPILHTEEFVKHIQKRKYEDLDLVTMVERYLIKKRGHIFRMPKPGSHVVLMASGGIDSTVAWYLLTKKYGLHVYPIMAIPNRFHPQETSLRFFSKIYKYKFGELFHEPFILRQSSVANELSALSRGQKFSSKALLDSYEPKHKSFSWAPGSGASMVNAIQAAIYLEVLRSTLGAPLTSIFCGVTAMDGIGVKSQTLTFIRLSNLYSMQFLANPTIQFASLFFEKETGWFARKADIIRSGATVGLPLERTYSCYRGGFVHCGTCGGCDARRWEFKKSGIEDKTPYRADGFFRPHIGELYQRLTGLISRRYDETIRR